MIYKKIKYIPQVDEFDCGVAALCSYTKKIVRNVGLPLVNQFLAQGYALVRILSALKIKSSTYYNWRNLHP